MARLTTDRALYGESRARVRNMFSPRTQHGQHRMMHRIFNIPRSFISFGGIAAHRKNQKRKKIIKIPQYNIFFESIAVCT